MKKHEFYITDIQGSLYYVTAAEFITKRGGIATAFNLRPCPSRSSFNTPPFMYVRYPIAKPGTGSVYWEYDFWTCKAIKRVSLRQFFPTWDMRRIRKEWRCLNG